MAGLDERALRLPRTAVLMPKHGKSSKIMHRFDPIDEKIVTTNKKKAADGPNTADLLEKITPHLSEFHACIREQKERDPSVSGRMNVVFTIQPDGRVSEVSVPFDFRQTHFAGCVSKVVRQIRFHSFQGQARIHSFPLVLT